MSGSGISWAICKSAPRSRQTPVRAGLMPTEARGNYLPELPYLLETKTYHSPPVESIRYDMLAVISSRYQYGFYHINININIIFIFFVAEVMSNYLTTDGLKKFLYFQRPP